MKYKLLKDLKKRSHYKNVELINLVFKYIKRSLSKNGFLKKRTRAVVYCYLNDKIKKSKKQNVVNRCGITARGRGVLQSFKVSRIYLKEILLKNELLNLKKAVW